MYSIIYFCFVILFSIYIIMMHFIRLSFNDSCVFFIYFFISSGTNILIWESVWGCGLQFFEVMDYDSFCALIMLVTKRRYYNYLVFSHLKLLKWQRLLNCSYLTLGYWILSVKISTINIHKPCFNPFGCSWG